MAINFLVDPTDKVVIKTERVFSEGSKQKFIELKKIIPGIKIVDIVPSLVNIRSIVKNGKVIVQGTLHKQIFFIGTDGLEHHLAEEIDFSELVEVELIDPTRTPESELTDQTEATVENLIFEFDPETGELIQKVIIFIEVKVTETVQLPVARDALGPVIKAEVVVGHGVKQKFVREEKNLDAIKIVDIVPRVAEIRAHVKTGKVIVQGVLHKQIFFVGPDNVVRHVAEDIDFSEMLEVPGALEDHNVQDESEIENLVWEFDPETGRLIQKVILRLRVKVTRTEEVAVGLDVYGPLIKAEVIVGRGAKQTFIEERKTLNAIKIVDIVPSLKDLTAVVKEGKVIVQGVLHKQVFFVGPDGLVHHIAEDIDFSEMVEVPGAEEGLNLQDHSVIENLVFEFDPETGELIQKVIINVEVVVTRTEQIRVLDP